MTKRKVDESKVREGAAESAPDKPPAAAAPGPPPSPGTLQLEASALARRARVFQDLRAGYPAAGAAELLMLHVASADGGTLQEIQDCELALAGCMKEALLREPEQAFAWSRLFRDVAHAGAVMRSRVQSSLTAAVTIAATARLGRSRPPDGSQ